MPNLRLTHTCRCFPEDLCLVLFVFHIPNPDFFFFFFFNSLLDICLLFSIHFSWQILKTSLFINKSFLLSNLMFHFLVSVSVNYNSFAINSGILVVSRYHQGNSIFFLFLIKLFKSCWSFFHVSLLSILLLHVPFHVRPYTLSLKEIYFSL